MAHADETAGAPPSFSSTATRLTELDLLLAWTEQGNSGSHWTLPWREMDSNFRFRAR
jgi:hypothetical protein